MWSNKLAIAEYSVARRIGSFITKCSGTIGSACGVARMLRPPKRIPDTKFPGGHRRRVTPVPIPNTEVKPSTADGTARAGAWESRSLPGIQSKASVRIFTGAFSFVPSYYAIAPR